MTWKRIAAGLYVNAAGVTIEGSWGEWRIFAADGNTWPVCATLAEAKELAADIPDYRDNGKDLK